MTAETKSIVAKTKVDESKLFNLDTLKNGDTLTISKNSYFLVDSEGVVKPTVTGVVQGIITGGTESMYTLENAINTKFEGNSLELTVNLGSIGGAGTATIIVEDYYSNSATSAFKYVTTKNNLNGYNSKDKTYSTNAIDIASLVNQNAYRAGSKASVTGTDFADKFDFTNKTDISSGYAINGGAGNDTIIGSIANDTITGGADNNYLSLESADIVIGAGTENANTIPGGFGKDVYKFNGDKSLYISTDYYGDEDDLDDYGYGKKVTSSVAQNGKDIEIKVDYVNKYATAAEDKIVKTAYTATEVAYGTDAGKKSYSFKETTVTKLEGTLSKTYVVRYDTFVDTPADDKIVKPQGFTPTENTYYTVEFKYDPTVDGDNKWTLAASDIKETTAEAENLVAKYYVGGTQLDGATEIGKFFTANTDSDNDHLTFTETVDTDAEYKTSEKTYTWTTGENPAWSAGAAVVTYSEDASELGVTYSNGKISVNEKDANFDVDVTGLTALPTDDSLFSGTKIYANTPKTTTLTYDGKDWTLGAETPDEDPAHVIYAKEQQATTYVADKFNGSTNKAITEGEFTSLSAAGAKNQLTFNKGTLVLENLAAKDPTAVESYSGSVENNVYLDNEYYPLTIDFDKSNLSQGKLTGTALGDYIDMSGVEDTVSAFIKGESGDDEIYGTKNNDTISGGDGSDEIYGGAGNDSISGGNGNDTLYGGTGNDTISGGKGYNDYKYNLSTGAFGDDVIQLTADEDANIILTDSTDFDDDQLDIQLGKNQKDVDVTVYAKADIEVSKITSVSYVQTTGENPVDLKAAKVYSKAVTTGAATADGTATVYEFKLGYGETAIDPVSTKYWDGDGYDNTLESLGNAKINQALNAISKPETGYNYVRVAVRGEGATATVTVTDKFLASTSDDAFDEAHVTNGNEYYVVKTVTYGLNTAKDAWATEGTTTYTYSAAPGTNGTVFSYTWNGGVAVPIEDAGVDFVPEDGAVEYYKRTTGYSTVTAVAENGTITWSDPQDPVTEFVTTNNEYVANNYRAIVTNSEDISKSAVIIKTTEAEILPFARSDYSLVGSVVYNDDVTKMGTIKVENALGSKAKGVYIGDGIDLLTYPYSEIPLSSDLKNGAVVKGTAVGDKIDASSIFASESDLNAKGLKIDGLAGYDEITGTKLADTIVGGAGDDELYGGAGNDILDGGADDDYLYGGAGDDSISGGAGDDFIEGGAGNDTLSAGLAGDTVWGGNTYNFDLDDGNFGDDVINLTANEVSYINFDGDVLKGQIKAEVVQKDGKATSDVLITAYKTKAAKVEVETVAKGDAVAGGDTVYTKVIQYTDGGVAGTWTGTYDGGDARYEKDNAAFDPTGKTIVSEKYFAKKTGEGTPAAIEITSVVTGEDKDANSVSHTIYLVNKTVETYTASDTHTTTTPATAITYTTDNALAPVVSYTQKDASTGDVTIPQSTTEIDLTEATSFLAVDNANTYGTVLVKGAAGGTIGKGDILLRSDVEYHNKKSIVSNAELYEPEVIEQGKNFTGGKNGNNVAVTATADKGIKVNVAGGNNVVTIASAAPSKKNVVNQIIANGKDGNTNKVDATLAKGNENFKLGAGIAEVTIDANQGAGNDTVVLAKGQTFKLYDDPTAGVTNVAYTYKGKDVVATITNGTTTSTVTLKQLGAKDNGAIVEILGDTLTGAAADTAITVTGSGKDNKQFNGTWLDDEATLASGATYKLGAGENTLKFDGTVAATAPTEATVTLSKGEDFVIEHQHLDNTGAVVALANPEQISYAYGYANNAKDVVVTASYDNDNTDGTAAVAKAKVTFKGLGSKDLVGDAGSVTLNDYNSSQGLAGGAGQLSLFDQTFTVTGDKKGDNKYNYTGTWLNDKATVLAGATHAEDVSSVKLGEGANTLDLSQTFAGKFGTVNYTFTKGEALTLDLTGSEYNQAHLIANGNDVNVNIYGTALVTAYTKEEAGTDIAANAIAHNAVGNTYHLTVGEDHYTLNTGTSTWDKVGGGTAYDVENWATDTKAITIVNAAGTFTVSNALADELLNAGHNGLVAGPINLYQQDVTTVYAWTADLAPATTGKYNVGVTTGTLVKEAGEGFDVTYYQQFGTGDNAELDEIDTDAAGFAVLTTATSHAQDKAGNVSDETLLGTVVLKNLAKDMATTTLTLTNLVTKAGHPADPTTKIVDAVVIVESDKAKVAGTFSNNKILATNEKAVTIATNYSKNNKGEIFFGEDEVLVNKDAKTTLQYTAQGKGVDKIAADEFDFAFEDGELTATYSEESNTSLNAYTVSGNDMEDADINLGNVTFVDGLNKKYQFVDANAGTVTEVDLKDKTKAAALGTKVSNNNIVFAANAKAITDNKLNDIIYAGSGLAADAEVTWNYSAGVDKYVSENATKDTYNVAFTAKTDFMVDDKGGADVLNLVDNSKKVISSANDLMLYFNVNQNDNIGGSSLLILQKNYKNANAFVNAVTTGKYTGGAVEVFDFFDVDPVGGRDTVDSLQAAETGHATGAGRIETVNVNGANANIDTKVASVASAVSAWLDDHGNYSDTDSVLTAGVKDDVESLLKVYQTGTYNA